MNPRRPNQGTAANAGGALSFQSERYGPGIAEFWRWAAFNSMKTAIVVAAICLSTFGSWAADALHRRGPITDAAEATKRAVAWANRETGKFGVKAFTEKSGTAVYDGKHWIWRAYVGQGTGDLEVIVYLYPRGGVPITKVNRLVSAAGAL
jgi:hypothetical protein